MEAEVLEVLALGFAAILAFAYILSKPESAEAMANIVEGLAEVVVRKLRARAAGKRAALAAYRLEHDLRWNRPVARRMEVEFWERVAGELES